MKRPQLEALLKRASSSPAAIALIFISAIAILQALAFGGLQLAQRDAAKAIDDSSLQRMRSQRIAFLAESARVTAPGPGWHAELRAAIDDFRSTARELTSNRLLLGGPIPTAGAAAERQFAAYLAGADRLDANPGDRAAISGIEANRVPILGSLDREFHAQAGYAAKRSDLFVWSIAMGLGVQLLAIFLLWVGFIRPAERRISTAFRLLQDQRRQTRSLFDINPAAIVILDRRGRIVRGNPAAEALMGGSGVRWLGREMVSILESGSHGLSDGAFANALEGENTTIEAQVVNASGERIDVRALVFPHVVDGKIVGAIAVAEDIRDLKLARAKADEGARRMMALYRIASDRRVDRYEEQIDAALRLLLQRLSLKWAALVRGEEGEREVLAIVPGNEAGIPTDILVGMDTRRIPIVTADGPPLALHLRADATSYSRIITDADAEFANLVAALIGTTIERQVHTSKLDRLAFYDGLTGLPNRTMLELRLEEALRQRTKFALHYIDLDQFKEVNDTLGHAAGDAVLRTAADRMKECVRRADLVARLGGDEFMVLQPIEHHADAARLAERLVSRLGDPFRVEGQPYQIGASVGIALASGGGDDDPELLMRLADTALYEAKRNGRARATFGNMVLPLPRDDKDGGSPAQRAV